MTFPAVAALTRALIRFDTTNPPGAEAECIGYLEGLFRSAGLDTWTAGAVPSRPNLVVRVPGRGEAPPLLLQGHVDVVTTVGQPWSRPAFGGDLVDGEVWGRGAIDMKGGVAMMACSAMSFVEAGTPPPGDLVLAVVADEEAGGTQGAAWLAAEHPELFTGIRHGIGEVGGMAVEYFGRRFYPVMVAEKRGAATRVIFRGSGGHASRPHRGGAMARLGEALVALDRARLPVHLTAATRMMLEGIRDAVGGPQAELLQRVLDPDRAEAALAELGPEGARFDPLLHNTVNATMVEGGLKINVIPSEIHLDLDCRLLPGQTRDDLYRELRAVLGDDATLEPLRDNPALPEPELGPFFDELCAILREADPSGTPIPYLVSGGTDARHFARLGIRCYGFLPHNFPPGTDYEKHMHDADERVPVSALEFGTATVTEALRRYRG